MEEGELHYSFMAFVLNRLDHNYFTPDVIDKLFSEEAMQATGLMRKRTKILKKKKTKKIKPPKEVDEEEKKEGEEGEEKKEASDSEKSSDSEEEKPKKKADDFGFGIGKEVFIKILMQSNLLNKRGI